MDEDDDGLVGDPESFLTFFSFSGGESGPFSTLGELVSYKTTKVLFSIHNEFYVYRQLRLPPLEVQDLAVQSCSKLIQNKSNTIIFSSC